MGSYRSRFHRRSSRDLDFGPARSLDFVSGPSESRFPASKLDQGRPHYPHSPPSKPLFSSGFGGVAPSQMDIRAREKSSPSIVPLGTPLSNTCTPACGNRTKVSRWPLLMSDIQVLNLAIRSASAADLP